MFLKKWFEYDPFESKLTKSAGIIIILNGKKILLCHSTDSKWFGSYSVPKGGVNEGETELDAAIRELGEETSLVVTKSQISNPKNPIIIDYINRKTKKKYKRLLLFTVHIEDIRELGLESEILPKEMLQLEEIDWCGFLDKEEARPRIFHRVEHLLNLLN
jgi:ADP-ribose pyrophosphatase YjhB (NUDIX family)